MNARNWMKHHALWLYFLIAYGLSWGLTLLGYGTGRFSGEVSRANSLLMAVGGMVAGPAAGGLLMTWVVEGRQGLRYLFSRMVRWKVGTGWIAAAVLTNTLLTVLVLLVLSVTVSPDYLQPVMPVGLLGGLLVGFFEEIGWTGFATPQLMKKYSPLATGLILGLLWGVWHLMGGFLGSMPGTESLWLREALVFWVGGLVAYRVLMTWVYTHTRSILVGQIMHGFFTGIFVTLVHGLTIEQSTLFYIVQGVALWAAAAIVAALTGKMLATRRARVKGAAV